MLLSFKHATCINLISLHQVIDVTLFLLHIHQVK